MRNCGNACGTAPSAEDPKGLSVSYEPLLGPPSDLSKNTIVMFIRLVNTQSGFSQSQKSVMPLVVSSSFCSVHSWLSPAITTHALSRRLAHQARRGGCGGTDLRDVQLPVAVPEPHGRASPNRDLGQAHGIAGRSIDLLAPTTSIPPSFGTRQALFRAPSGCPGLWKSPSPLGVSQEGDGARVEPVAGLRRRKTTDAATSSSPSSPRNRTSMK